MSSSSTASSDRTASRYVAALLVGVVLALAVAEWALRALVVPLEEGWSHRVDLVYRGESGDVVLGDSHTFRGFVSQDDFVNLSAGGSSVPAMEVVAREYFRHREPGRVIVAADPQLFVSKRDSAGTQQHDEYFGQNLGLPFQLYVFEPGIARMLGELADPRTLRRRIAMAEARREPGNRLDASLQRKWLHGDRADQLRRIADRNRPMEDLPSTGSFAAYRRLIESMQARGARLCMLATPVAAAMEGIIDEDPPYRAARVALRALARDLEVPLVEPAALGVEFPDELFIDPDHLTATGAERFSSAAIAACFPAGA